MRGKAEEEEAEGGRGSRRRRDRQELEEIIKDKAFGKVLNTMAKCFRVDARHCRRVHEVLKSIKDARLNPSEYVSVIFKRNSKLLTDLVKALKRKDENMLAAKIAQALHMVLSHLLSNAVNIPIRIDHPEQKVEQGVFSSVLQKAAKSKEQEWTLVSQEDGNKQGGGSLVRRSKGCEGRCQSRYGAAVFEGDQAA